MVEKRHAQAKQAAPFKQFQSSTLIKERTGDRVETAGTRDIQSHPAARSRRGQQSPMVGSSMPRSTFLTVRGAQGGFPQDSADRLTWWKDRWALKAECKGRNRPADNTQLRRKKL